MGHWRAEFDEITRKAIRNYAKHYQLEENRVRIKMALDTETGKIRFFTVVDGQDYEQVKFLKILHGPKAKLDITGLTLMVPRFIRKALEWLAERFVLDPGFMYVLAMIDGNDIFLFLMEGERMVKIITDEDLLADEEVALMQAEDQKNMQEGKELDDAE